MKRFWSAAILVLLPLLIGQTAAQAQSCGSARSPSGGAGGERVAQLQRQLTAVRSIERKRQCMSEKSQGGFFNACRDLANQRRRVEAALSAARGGSYVRNSENCRASSRQQSRRRQPTEVTAPPAKGARAPQQQKSAPKKYGNVVRAGKAILYCVRLSDGYLFPAPNSQFVGKDAAEATLRQCQYICEDQAMDVYVLEDSDLETDQMISIQSKASYKDLPRAFWYRSQETFQKCDWNRYVDRIHELQLTQMMSENMEDVSVPVPEDRPELDENEISTEATASITADRPLIDRPIRIIGTPFLPARSSAQ